MARLLTAGYETKAALTEGLTITGTTLTFDTTTVRTAGTVSGKVATSGGGYFGYTIPAASQGTGKTFFWRSYLYIPTGGDNSSRLIEFVSSGSVLVQVRSNGGEQLFLADSSGTQQGNLASAISLNAWHRIEVAILVPATGNGTAHLFIDGTEVTSGGSQWAMGNTALTDMDWGSPPGGTVSLTMYYDDTAVNDDSGTNQNSYPGDGAIVLLVPTSDNAVGTNWVAGAGGKTHLFNAVSPTPPVGVAEASATNTSQVKNDASDATGNYDANLTTYTAAGVTGTVQLVQGVAAYASAATTSITGALAGVSNPALTEVTQAQAVAAGTFPTGWVAFNTSVAYAPSVTLGTAPVLRVGKRTANVSGADFCFMGLLVEWVASSGVSIPATTLAGVGSLTGNPTVTIPVAPTTLAGVGSLTATVTVTTVVTGTLAGVGQLSGTVTVTTALVGTLAGVGSVAGAPTVTIPIAATTLVGVGAFSGAPTVTTVVPATTLAGVGSLSGAPTVTTVVSGQLSGVGSLVGTVTVGSAGVSVAGQLSGIGQLAGTVTATTALVATLAGIGALAGVVTVTIPIAPTTLAGVGSLSGVVTVTTLIPATTLAGAGALTGVVVVSVALVATLSGVGSLTGTLTITVALTAQLSGQGTLAGVVVTTTVLTGVLLSGVGSLSGTVLVVNVLLLTGWHGPGLGATANDQAALGALAQDTSGIGATATSQSSPSRIAGSATDQASLGAASNGQAVLAGTVRQ